MCVCVCACVCVCVCAYVCTIRLASSPRVLHNSVSLFLYFSGLWSLLAVALFVGTFDNESLCYTHATFEGLCFCDLRLPHLVS